MRKRVQKHFVLVCTILICSVAICSARVFLRWGAASQSTRALQALGGKIAYEAAVTINGGKGQLAVLNFNRPPSALVPEIRRTFGVKQFGFAQGNTAVAVARSENTVVRLIALRLGGPDRMLVFKIEQSAADFSSSNTRPDAHLLTALPGYPGSVPEFFVKDNNTDSSLAVSTARNAPETVRDFFRTRLTGSGWTAALAPTDKAHELLRDQSVAIYLKGHRLCCVMVSPGRAGTSRITLLHKTQGMK